MLGRKPKISVEVTHDEYDVLREEAKAGEITISKLVRLKLFPGAPAITEEDAPSTPKEPARRVHPCMHLSNNVPKNFKATDCQGTCAHRSNSGRPCFWTTGVAHNCPMFTKAKAA